MPDVPSNELRCQHFNTRVHPLMRCPPLTTRHTTDPESSVALLSMPPNVNFAEGLTSDKVLEGPPLWAGQRPPTYGMKEKLELDKEEKERQEFPPPPASGGRAQKKMQLPDAGPQRMQVNDTWKQQAAAAHAVIFSYTIFCFMLNVWYVVTCCILH